MIPMEQRLTEALDLSSETIVALYARIEELESENIRLRHELAESRKGHPIFGTVER